MQKRISISFAVMLAACIPAVSDVFAQEAESAFPISSDTDLTRRSSVVIVKKRDEQIQSKGIAVGSFLLIPAISLTEYHDDNVYAAETNTHPDYVTVISPTFNLNSQWSKHKLDINAGMDLLRYADLTNENVDDYWAGISGRYDFSAKQNVFGGVNYTRDHEDRASPDAVSGDTPTTFDDYLAHVGHAFVGGRHRTRVAYTVNKLDFQNVTGSSGIIDNSDRDRTEQALGLRYLYKYTPVTALFVEAVVDKRAYDQTPDFAGNDRNSDGYRYSLGMEHVGTTSVLRIFAGSLGRDYQSAVFENQSAFDFGLDYTWNFGAASKLVVHGGRAIEETTFDNSSGYLMTDASVRMQVGISPGKSLNLSAIKSTADYYGIDRTDDYTDYSLGYSQQLLANLLVSLDLRRSKRDSNVAGSDFTINQIILRISGVI